jgi:hypothetical protein
MGIDERNVSVLTQAVVASTIGRSSFSQSGTEVKGFFGSDI